MSTSRTPGLGETAPVWARIGVLSFGGPAAQIALMHREIVEERGWLSEEKFLRTISFCMLLPGPEAMQIATYVGWRLNGTIGGVIAGGLFVLPGACVILALSLLYLKFGQVPLVQTAFLGVQAAVIAIVLKALWGISGRALKVRLHWVLAVFGFFGLFVFDLPFVLVIFLAGVIGFFAHPPETGEARPMPQHGGLARRVFIWGSLWAAPLVLLWLVDPNGLLLQIGLFFSKLAVVTFGGAYAVLAYMAQEAVTGFGWLSADQMMDGVGLAETTPGPLILVTQFVGFMAGAGIGAEAGAGAGVGQGGLMLALAAAALTLWVTFVPCFLWIFAAAPYVDWITTRPRLNGALQGITAAVVGVILNLSVWFALHVIFAEVNRSPFAGLSLWVPDLASVNLMTFGLSALATVLLLRFKASLGILLASCAGLALVWGAVIGV